MHRQELVRCSCCNKLHHPDNYHRPVVKCFDIEIICPECRRAINESLGSPKNKFMTKEELKNRR